MRLVLRRLERALMVVEPPGQARVPRVAKIEHRVLLAGEGLVAEQLPGAVGEAPQGDPVQAQAGPHLLPVEAQERRARPVPRRGPRRVRLARACIRPRPSERWWAGSPPDRAAARARKRVSPLPRRPLRRERHPWEYCASPRTARTRTRAAGCARSLRPGEPARPDPRPPLRAGRPSGTA